MLELTNYISQFLVQYVTTKYTTDEAKEQCSLGKQHPLITNLPHKVMIKNKAR